MAGLPTPEEYERWEVPHRAFHLVLLPMLVPVS